MISDFAAFRSVRSILEEAIDALVRRADGTPEPAPSTPSLIGRAARELGNVGVLARTGIVSPMRPDKPLRMALAAQRWGATLAAGVAANAIRHGDRAMLIDELGSLSWAELDRAQRRDRRRACRARHRRGRRGRAALPQPPGLRRGGDGGRQARRRRTAAQHRLRRAADRRGQRARGSERADLRRGVRPADRGGRRGAHTRARLRGGRPTRPCRPWPRSPPSTAEPGRRRRAATAG